MTALSEIDPFGLFVQHYSDMIRIVRFFLLLLAKQPTQSIVCPRCIVTETSRVSFTWK